MRCLFSPESINQQMLDGWMWNGLKKKIFLKMYRLFHFRGIFHGCISFVYWDKIRLIFMPVKDYLCQWLTSSSFPQSFFFFFFGLKITRECHRRWVRVAWIKKYHYINFTLRFLKTTMNSCNKWVTSSNAALSLLKQTKCHKAERGLCELLFC